MLVPKKDKGGKIMKDENGKIIPERKEDGTAIKTKPEQNAKAARWMKHFFLPLLDNDDDQKIIRGILEGPLSGCPLLRLCLRKYMEDTPEYKTFMNQNYAVTK